MIRLSNRHQKKLVFLVLSLVFVVTVMGVVGLRFIYPSIFSDKKVSSLEPVPVLDGTTEVNQIVETFVSLLVAGSYDKAAPYLHPEYLKSEGLTESAWISNNKNSNLDKYVDGYEFIGFAPASELATDVVAGNPDYVALFRLTSESKEPLALSTYPVDMFLFLSQYDGSYRISFGSNDMMFNMIELGIETSEDAFAVLSLMEEGVQ